MHCSSTKALQGKPDMVLLCDDLLLHATVEEPLITFLMFGNFRFYQPRIGHNRF